MRYNVRLNFVNTVNACNINITNKVIVLYDYKYKKFVNEALFLLNTNNRILTILSFATTNMEFMLNLMK